MNENLREQFAVLPGNLANHLMITVLALLVGLLISLPLAVFVVKHQRLRYPTLAVVSIIQTIPSLALLALMVPLLGAVGALTARLFGVEIAALGFYPTIIALTLYSMLPIVRNTVTGIVGVDATVTEAARGVGMRSRQVLWKVELPLAAPVIIAGVRTATVWVTGIATLATPVGQRCLGNYIFSGLQTRNAVAVLFGCVAAALLALVLDLLIGGVERAARDRRRTLGAISLAGLLVIVVGGLASPTIMRSLRGGALQPARASAPAGRAAPGGGTGFDRPVRVGAKTFTEQYILAALLRSALEEAGFRTTLAESLGSTVVFDGLCSGEIDVYVDYSGTIWANHMGHHQPAPPWKVLDVMSGWLAETHGVRCLGALGFENAYALALRRDRAIELGIRTIGDLAAHAPGMKIGGDYEFFQRPEWRQIRETYGLKFAEQISYDSTFMYSAVAQGAVDVISAFSSDGRIAALDLVTLDDPRQAIPPYDAVLLLSPAAAQAQPLVQALRPLVGAIDVTAMRRANYLVDRDTDKKTVAEAARWLRERLRGSQDPEFTVTSNDP